VTYSHRLRRLKRALFCGLVRRYPKLSGLLPAVVPVNVQRVCRNGHSELVIFLPGIGDVIEDFELNGFIDALSNSARPADIVVADLHFGYYLRHSALERLREDVIEPAKRQGYETISLAGISLGGLGALLYTMEYPKDVQRLMLLAPYVGQTDLVNEIGDAGGVAAWNPGEVSADEYPRKLWLWLKQCASVESALPEIYLGYGDRDCFARGNALLSRLIPKRNVFTVRGTHEWRTWKHLWQMFVERRDAGNI